MKKVFVAAVISMVALVGCSANSTPSPVVTITEQIPVPPDNNNYSPPDVSSYIFFMRDNGGMYASVASESDLISMGNSICRGFRDGLSEDQVIAALAQALIESGMNNDAGALFAGTLVVGAKRYLCPGVGV